jgi:hypothetical protein
VERLAENFSKDTEIVLTIRANVGLMTSLYQQKVKTGYKSELSQVCLNEGGGQNGEEFFKVQFTKLATDDLIDTLLGHFEKVTVIDLNKDGYHGWLTDLTGITPEEMSLLAGADSSKKRLNPSLSSEGVMHMERLNRVLKYLFPFLTPASQSGSDSKNRQRLLNAELSKWQKLVATNAGRLKAAVARLLIILARILGQKKYQLPTHIQTLINATFPASKASKLVASHGGIYTFRSEQTKIGGQL